MTSEVSLITKEGADTNSPTFETALNIVAIGVLAFLDKVRAWWAHKEEAYRRAALRAAYQKRHCWKRRDAVTLRALGASPVALRLAEHAPKRGRPSLRPYLPLGEKLIQDYKQLQPAFEPSATPRERRQALKTLPGFGMLVEITCLVEAESLRSRRTPNPAREAEAAVGRVLAVSADTVHEWRQKARRSGTYIPGHEEGWNVSLTAIEDFILYGKLIEVTGTS